MKTESDILLLNATTKANLLPTTLNTSFIRIHVYGYSELLGFFFIETLRTTPLQYLLSAHHTYKYILGVFMMRLSTTI
jgi:hypothetical protein